MRRATSLHGTPIKSMAPWCCARCYSSQEQPQLYQHRGSAWSKHRVSAWFNTAGSTTTLGSPSQPAAPCQPHLCSHIVYAQVIHVVVPVADTLVGRVQCSAGRVGAAVAQPHVHASVPGCKSLRAGHACTANSRLCRYAGSTLSTGHAHAWGTAAAQPIQSCTPHQQAPYDPGTLRHDIGLLHTPYTDCKCQPAHPAPPAPSPADTQVRLVSRMPCMKSTTSLTPGRGMRSMRRM
jgi:hypothetical protein